MALQIRKKSAKVWLHVPDDSTNYIISKFYCKSDGNSFKIIEDSGSNRREYLYSDITVYDDTGMGTAETFASVQLLMLRLEELNYVGFNRDGDVPNLINEAPLDGQTYGRKDGGWVLVSGGSDFDPSEHDLDEFLNASGNNFIRETDINEHFKGKYTTFGNLNTAHPTAADGDYAIVDAGSGSDAVEYIWDTDEGWLEGGSAGAATTDALPEGVSNLYFTTARVLATVLSGISFITGGAIVSTDTVLQAMGKLQKQITDLTSSKQDTLISATNIKTINGNSVLGSGNITISGGGSSSNLVLNTQKMEAFGDSISVGQASTGFYNYFGYLLSVLYNMTITNRAVSGTGVFDALYKHNLYINPADNKFTTFMSGFNDVRNYALATSTVNKIKSAYRLAIANQFLDNYSGANSGFSVITFSGTWAGLNTSTLGGKSTVGAYPTAPSVGKYIEYTFKNDNVVVSMIGADGTTFIGGTFDVLLDGVAYGSYTLNNQTNAANTKAPYALIIQGLTDTSHTIRITCTDSNYLAVDYFGHMKKSKFCTPMLLVHATKLDATGYATGAVTIDDTVINGLNTVIDNIAAEFPDYPLFVAQTNDHYNIATGLSADHIHPNDIGHRQIYNACFEALADIPSFNQIFTTENTFSKKQIFQSVVEGQQGFRATGAVPATATGLALETEPGKLISYNRTSGAYYDLLIAAEKMRFYVNNTYLSLYVGQNILMGTYTDTGAGDRLQVTGSTQMTGMLKVGKFTTGTAPSYILGGQYFDTTLNKMRIGGASAWETVTST